LVDFDALVAGAGPAGCAAAAALGELGLRVLVVDAGMDATKQLAGELIHPPGVEDLTALGFAPLTDAGAQPVRGFAVIDERVGSTSLLPYGDGEGMALEHAHLRRALSKGLEGRSGICVWPRARIVEVSRNAPDGMEAAVRREGGSPQLVRARLLVAADGRASHARGLLGIGEARERLSSMVGVLVDAALLPHPGFGHLFVGGAAPVLGYAIAPGAARIMVDLPAASGAAELAASPELVAGLPGDLRQAVLEAARSGRVLTAANETRLPHSVAAQSAVLVGDAAGCCHPLSASGLSSCTRDARALQNAVRRYPDDFPIAAKWYAAQRRAPQRTRIALASALYRTFSRQTAEMTALRAGLFRYWGRTRTGPSVSMALLSTRESRMWIMAREYARAVGFGLSVLRSGAWNPGTAIRLASTVLPHLGTLLSGALEDLRAASGRVLMRLRARRAHRPAVAEPEPSRAPLSRL
jgi:2-polyprenyl-6-methoxyphenol hydroxylase-like FAD-dependent oxidoreductase